MCVRARKKDRNNTISISLTLSLSHKTPQNTNPKDKFYKGTWDNPSPTVPSRVELFLEAHSTGKDLCFSDAEMVMWWDFRVAEMKKIRD
jgi:hypothetical protein